MSSLDGGTELQAMFIHDDYMTRESFEVADSNYVTSNTVYVVAHVTSDENGEAGNGKGVEVDGFHVSVVSKMCSSVDKSVVVKLTEEHKQMSFFTLLPIVG